jgi:hypothetical protein
MPALRREDVIRNLSHLAMQIELNSTDLRTYFKGENSSADKLDETIRMIRIWVHEGIEEEGDENNA